MGVTGKGNGNNDVHRPMVGKESRTDNVVAQRARVYWVAESFFAIHAVSSAGSVLSSTVSVPDSGKVALIGVAAVSCADPKRPGMRPGGRLPARSRLGHAAARCPPSSQRRHSPARRRRVRSSCVRRPW